MLTIGVHTHITNPLSAGYLCYLASIKSWAKLVDQVVVVDGGSTDGSLERLNECLGPLNEKVRVIAPPDAHWGADDRWEWPQIAINRQIGLEALDTDWAIHVDADHVAPEKNPDDLRHELKMHSNSTLLVMPILFYDNGKFLQRKAPRAWVLNLRKIRAEGMPVSYGMDRLSGTHLDYPIFITSKQTFKDPDTGFAKSFCWGELVPGEGQISLQPFSMGHFFFTPEQCMAKNLRLSVVSGRFRGVGPRTKFEISHELRLHRVMGFERRDNLLKKSFSKEVIELIEAFYNEDMLGGLLYCKPNPFNEKLRSTLCLALRAKRKIPARLLRVQCMMNSPKRWQRS